MKILGLSLIVTFDADRTPLEPLISKCQLLQEKGTQYDLTPQDVKAFKEAVNAELAKLLPEGRTITVGCFA